MHVFRHPSRFRLEDVINVEQARIAEEAGAVAVMALERIPADIRVDGGVARMSDPKMIREIKAAVSIPVMAKVCARACVVFGLTPLESENSSVYYSQVTFFPKTGF